MANHERPYLEDQTIQWPIMRGLTLKIKQYNGQKKTNNDQQNTTHYTVICLFFQEQIYKYMILHNVSVHKSYNVKTSWSS
jgi:hypothetical protein